MAARKPAKKKKAVKKQNGRSRTRKTNATRPSVLWRLIKVGFVFALLSCVVAAGYLFHLDRTITKTFEGRRWSVPAQVYAQPLELFTGVALSQSDLVHELQRVGYQRRGTLNVPGTFNITGNRLRAYLRGFEFMDGYRDAMRIEASFAGKTLTALTANGEPAVIVQLEPPSIGSFFPSHGEDRVILAPEQVPELLREGLKLVEDKSFDKHFGFDLRGILRAIWVNLRAGEKQQGGSTLTQQLVKSYFLDNSRTYRRKLRELGMSIILEARFEKSDLLNAYINEIYLAQDGVRAIHGFGLGAQFYFNKPLAELDTHEIALLLTVIRGPSYYNPWRNPERVRERRDRIINALYGGGLIDKAAATRAAREALALAGTSRPGGAYYPAFMDLVREQLNSNYPPKALASEGLRIFTTLKPAVQERLQRGTQNALAQLEVRKPSITNNEGPLQVAAIVTQSQTGDVLALLGGRGRGGYNRALKASRPIGSLIKPVVYLSALEHPDFHLATQIQDIQVNLPQPNGEIWTPKNFDEKLHGSVPLIRGLADSLNLATVQLGLQLGVPEITSRLEDLVIDLQSNPYPSMLLGAVNMNVLQVSELYGNFASGGFHSSPKAVIAVLDESNTPLSRYPLQSQQSVSSEAVAQLTEGMRVAMQRGTGRSSRLAQRGVAGKTGTSNDFRDSWFAGFDAATLAVVWVGFDDNKPTGLTGASGALRVWDAFMSSTPLFPLQPTTTNGEAGGLQNQRFDFNTGLRASAGCSRLTSEGLMAPVELISVPLPGTVELPFLPGCADSTGTRGNKLGDRLKRWFSPD